MVKIGTSGYRTDSILSGSGPCGFLKGQFPRRKKGQSAVRDIGMMIPSAVVMCGIMKNVSVENCCKSVARNLKGMFTAFISLRKKWEIPPTQI